MNKEEVIKDLKEKIPVMIEKCRNTRFTWLQVYRVGKLYIYNETYRRLTGEQFDISKAYFMY